MTGLRWDLPLLDVPPTPYLRLSVWEQIRRADAYSDLRGCVVTKQPHTVTRLCDRASGTIVTRGRR